MLNDLPQDGIRSRIGQDWRYMNKVATKDWTENMRRQISH